MLKYLLEKEFKQLLRNPFIPKLIVIMPIMVMLIFPWATTMEIKNLNLSILDNSGGSQSQELIQKIVSSGYFRISDVAMNYEDAMESIEYGESDIILEIPSDFDRNLAKQKASTVLISANSVNASKANMGVSYLSSIINEYALGDASAGLGGITIMPSYRYNPTSDYKIPMLPALMVLLLTLICGFLPSMNMVMEKELGTIEQINVSPVPKYLFILGKLLPYWIIGVVVFTLAIIVTYLVYGLAPKCNIFFLYAMALLYIFSISGLGMIISNYSNTLQQAMFMIFFIVVIMILISGLLTPIDSMPVWAQYVAHFSPLTYFGKIMRGLYLKDSGFMDILPNIAALLGFFAVLTTWAVRSYKK